MTPGNKESGFDYENFLSAVHGGREVKLVDQVEQPDLTIPAEQRPLTFIQGPTVSFDFRDPRITDHPLTETLITSDGPHHGEAATFLSATTGQFVMGIVRNGERAIFGGRSQFLGLATYGEPSSSPQPEITMLEHHSSVDIKNFIGVISRPPLP